MFIKNINLKVISSEYSQRHFAKDFLKKYKIKKWEITQKFFSRTLEKCSSLQETKLIDVINFSQKDDCGIFKLDFAVAGERQSPKTAGNRLIFFVDNEKAIVEILLVYGKNHCPKGQPETQWIKEQIKGNFPKYKKYCT